MRLREELTLVRIERHSGQGVELEPDGRLAQRVVALQSVRSSAYVATTES